MKNPTHLHVLIKVYELHPLEVRSFLSKICDASMPHFSYLPKTPLKSLSGRIWKRRQKYQMPLVRFHTHWAIKRIIWGTYFCFTKLIKPSDRWLIIEWMFGDFVITILSCNRPRTWKSYMSHMNQGKGWIKMSTYLNCRRILCYRRGTCELYST